MPDSRDDNEPLHVICLCAEWCGVCGKWRTIFDEAARAHPDIRFSWIDVEDEADAMGDVDIEMFPTLLIARGDSPKFFGPVQSSGAQLNRLIASLSDASTAHIADESAALLGRLAPRTLSKR